jgi:uncharacterized membrane protein YbhN (UPF0104 family)
MNLIKRIPVKKIVALGIGTAAIFFILFKTVVDIRSFTLTAQGAQSTFLWYALLVILPTFLLSPLRWQYVLKAYGYHLKFKYILSMVTAAGAFILIPGRLGDFIRSYFTKDEIVTAESVGSIFIEKILDVIILLLISGIGLLLLDKSLYALVVLAAAVVLPIGITVVKKVGLRFGLAKISLVKKVADSIRIPKHPRYLLAASVASTANWATSIISTYFLFIAFHVYVPLSAVIAYLPLTIFAGLIPISIAGIGIRDSAIIGLFGPYATTAQSLAVGICYSFLSYFLFMLVGIPFVFQCLHTIKLNR